MTPTCDPLPNYMQMFRRAAESPLLPPAAPRLQRGRSRRRRRAGPSPSRPPPGRCASKSAARPCWFPAPRPRKVRARTCRPRRSPQLRPLAASVAGARLGRLGLTCDASLTGAHPGLRAASPALLQPQRPQRRLAVMWPSAQCAFSAVRSRRSWLSVFTQRPRAPQSQKARCAGLRSSWSLLPEVLDFGTRALASLPHRAARNRPSTHTCG